MGGKLSPLIILILLVVLIGVGGLIFKTIFVEETVPGPDNIENEYSLEQPLITLNKEVNAEDSSLVTISVYATTESGEPVIELTLPDGTTVPGDTTTYVVDTNGKYTFEALTESGGIATADIEVTEIAEVSATNPYIPDGFSVIANNVEEGFVIADEKGNQYVWIPVPTGKMTRETMLNAEYEESSGTALALVNSVAKYYGFYLGRFEASQFELNGEVTAASMAGRIPWTNISYMNAVDHAENSGTVFGYTDCSTALLNSYAWDTTIEWIDQVHLNYSSDVSYGNYSGTIYPTGYTEKDTVKNICDLAGNVREWTTEIYKVANSAGGVIHRVVRGGSANLKRTPISHIYYPENTSDNYWGFRLILYK